MNYDTTSDAYAHKVYAGVLGKMIGVYLGRPIEGMPYRELLKMFGTVDYFVHLQRKRELIVPDDDLTGTFTFVRAIEDNRATLDTLTAEQIGRTWLNYVVENKTIFWWGGLGLSTEHTAFLRLKDGIPAPRSGSAELNSNVVAEQIGSQIFIDGWAMIAPGDPRRAADLARRAASVSHDGEAIYGAQVVAAMEALAFVEPDLNVLLDTAVGLIPRDSLIYRMIADLRAFHAKHPDDWQRAFVDVMEASYGYDKFGGNCHIIPNHGVIILALLYGRDGFQRTQMIANTCGWDTDCNAGNVGCLMGIKNGLAGIDAGPDWRGPMADRLLLPTADGGECVSDAARETVRLVNVARASQQRAPWRPKDGARFHFSLPGSVQGFTVDDAFDSRDAATVSNADGRLAVAFRKLAAGRVARVGTPTFAQPQMTEGAYGLTTVPTLWSGQTVRAVVRCQPADAARVTGRLFVRVYGAKSEVHLLGGPAVALEPDVATELVWTVPTTDDRPIFQVGLEIAGDGGATGTAYVDRVAWSGPPDVTLGRPHWPGDVARRQWMEALDVFNVNPGFGGGNAEQAFLLVHNRGRGLAITGTRDWDDYEVAATLTPHLANAAGLAARVRGLRRYYALVLKRPNRAALIAMKDEETVLAEADFPWRWNDDPHALALRVQGGRIVGSIDGKALFDVVDPDPIPSGGVALLIEQGRMATGPVRVRPIS